MAIYIFFKTGNMTFSDPLLSTLLKHLWQRLQPWVLLGMKLQAWHTCIWGVFLPFFSADPLKLCQVERGALLHSYFQVSPEIFDRVQVRAMAGPLKDITKLVPKPLLLCQSDHQVLLTYLTKALLPCFLSLPGLPAEASILVVPNFFHLRMLKATVFLGTFNAANIFGTLPQICASTQSCLWALRTIPLTSWLGFCSDMHCQLRDLI